MIVLFTSNVQAYVKSDPIPRPDPSEHFYDFLKALIGAKKKPGWNTVISVDAIPIILHQLVSNTSRAK